MDEQIDFCEKEGNVSQVKLQQFDQILKSLEALNEPWIMNTSEFYYWINDILTEFLKY